MQATYGMWLHNNNVFSWIDPAGFDRVQTDANTCARVLKECGFKEVRPGEKLWEPRRKSVEGFLTKIYGEGAALEISEHHCPILIEGFGGGYRYPDAATEIEPTKIRPVKDKYSHPHDAFQYLASGVTRMKSGYKFDIPEPRYNFQSNTQGDQQWQNSPKTTPSGS